MGSNVATVLHRNNATEAVCFKGGSMHVVAYSEPLEVDIDQVQDPRIGHLHESIIKITSICQECTGVQGRISCKR